MQVINQMKKDTQRYSAIARLSVATYTIFVILSSIALRSETEKFTDTSLFDLKIQSHQRGFTTSLLIDELERQLEDYLSFSASAAAFSAWAAAASTCS